MARHAFEKHGAVYGRGVGLQGKSYALPTMDKWLVPLSLDEIGKQVSVFKEFAGLHPEMTFYITPVGCGLAGYRRDEIRPFFDGMPTNCRFAETWEDGE